MPGTNNTMDELIIKYLEKSLSAEEQAELKNWISASDDNKQLFEKLTKKEWVNNELKKFYKYEEEKGWDKVKKSLPPKMLRPSQSDKGIKKYNWRWVPVAASIILTLGIGSYFIFFNKGKQNEIVKTTTNPVPNDVTAPTATKVMITLADGRKVSLDSLASGTLATQGNVNVVKTADGQIVYNGSSAVVEYNVIFNPRGSKVQPLTLSDGTKVWLNSESSLRFPTAFIGNERNVEITGEAYFEVAKDATKKFIVTGSRVTTEVLGTHFNVNTYADESSIKVTLLEGSVKVTKGNAFGLLKPGQQAQVATDPSTPLRVTSNVNVDEVMAWKNGRFAYNNADLETIMRQMARWYNVEVVYKEKITDRYTVTTTRDVPVSELFKYIEMSGGVHFKIEDRKITVMK